VGGGWEGELGSFGIGMVTLMGRIDTLVLSVSRDAVRRWNTVLPELDVSFPKGNGWRWREIDGVTKK
jgi:hypothetical protein